jgi:PKHD-type hydroxylase
MSDLDPTTPFAAWDNAFSPTEMSLIEAYGDQLGVERATLYDRSQGDYNDKLRITDTGWIEPNAETRWIYERLQGVVRALNAKVWQFDLTGFSENLQYTVYRGSDGGHFDWHVDQGPLRVRRKLSISVQLTDPARYEGCDLQIQTGNKILDASRRRGTVIAFPSYVLHRVTPIVSGTRKALVAWTTGPQFR